jgi:outer membrane protein assembly factor BamD
MLTKLILAKAVLNEAIAELYQRVDKPKAAKYYKAKESEKWIDWSKVNRANTPWYREWFEGDGTSSWYAFLIPDTQSVVSRNSVIDDDNTTLMRLDDNETK